jgi:hypothetical protein
MSGMITETQNWIGRERPIQFSAQMVRAILDGTKTQTRRAIVPVPEMIKRIRNVPRPVRDGEFIACQFGQVGDRLWVRERWAMEQDQVIYAADAACSLALRWRSSYVMPRSACRILLQVSSLRIERLAKITRTDARNEGYPGDMLIDDPIAWFRNLWDGLCKPQHAWKMNPWVWVIGFKRIDTTE